MISWILKLGSVTVVVGMENKRKIFNTVIQTYILKHVMEMNEKAMIFASTSAGRKKIKIIILLKAFRLKRD